MKAKKREKKIDFSQNKIKEIGIIMENSIFQILPDAHSCPASSEWVDTLSYNFPCIVSLLCRANQFCFDRIRAKPSSYWNNMYIP